MAKQIYIIICARKKTGIICTTCYIGQICVGILFEVPSLPNISRSTFVYSHYLTAVPYPQDIGHHGTPARSLKHHLLQLRRENFSSDNLRLTIDKLFSRSSPASPSLHSPRHVDTFQLFESYHMPEEPQLPFSYHIHLSYSLHKL